MKKVFFTLIILIAVCTIVEARNAKDFFISAPESVIRLLPQSTRLDMTDYFEYGSKRASENFFGGDARISAISDNVIDMEVDSDISMQIAMLTSKSDTILAVITTISLPSPDSTVKFFDKSWTPLNKQPFILPDYTEWLTETGIADLNNLKLHLPFIPVKARFNSDATELLLSNEAQIYLGTEQYRNFSSRLIESMIFDVTGARFIRRK